MNVADQRQLQAVLAMMEVLRPTFLSTKPSVLAALVSVHADTAPRADIIVVGGAALDPDLRRRAEIKFSGTAVSLYATSEVGVIASECRLGRLHIHEADVHVTDRHVNAPSEMVVTSIANQAMPLIGYRTGDTGVIASTPCTCGAAWRWIERLDGRSVPLFHFTRGDLISPTRLNAFLRLFPNVREFQVTQHPGDAIEVRVEHRIPPTDDERLAIDQFFASELPFYVKAHCIDVVFDPNEKFARFRVETPI